MKSSLRNLALFLCSVGMLGFAAPAAAQADSVDFLVGYQFAGGPELEPGGGRTNFPLGFDVGVGFPLTGNLNVIADLNWGRHSEDVAGVSGSVKILGVGGGIQWASTTNPSFTPFVHLILGMQRDTFSTEVMGVKVSDSESNFMLQPGAGVAFPLGNTAMQGFVNGNFRRVFYEGEGENFFTVVAGVVVSFTR